MRGRWLIVGLVVSLALNLFLVGAGAGVIALGLRMARDNPRPGAALMVATQGLPQPDRYNLRSQIRDARQSVKVQAEQSRALRMDAWGSLAAPTPDAAAIKQKLAQSRQLDIGVRTQVEEQLVDDVLRLSPQNRAIFADGMKRVLTPPRPAQKP